MYLMWSQPLISTFLQFIIPFHHIICCYRSVVLFPDGILAQTMNIQTLQPKSSLSLLYSVPPGFSVFCFAFPISYTKLHDGILSQIIFPSFSVFSYPSLAVKCLLQGFLWYTMIHSDYVPCPPQYYKFDKFCDLYIFV
jgi:hypothetical protein